MLPSPPTDNLYKFIAIAGLLLIGFYFYRYETVLSEVARRRIDGVERMAILTEELNELGRKTADLENDVKRLEEAAARKGTAVSQGQVDEAQSRYARLQEFRLQFATKRAQLDSAKEAFDFELERMRAHRRGGRFLIAAGMLLANVGFLFWYVMLQRHQDTIVARQSRKES